MINRKETEIVFNDDGTVYHLNIKGDDLADDILLVGDPGRVKLIASLFSHIENSIEHREFVTVTGFFGGKRVSVIATGIGVDNVDIVVNEIDIAANYNREKVCFERNRTFNLIRLGTSGALQPEVKPGSLVMTEYAIGIDGLFSFYQDSRRIRNDEISNSFIKATNWPVSLPEPYAVGCSYSLANRLDITDHKGLTITSPGFYAPQGRFTGLNPAFPDLNRRIAAFSFMNLKVLNYEMESSALYALGRSLGYKTLTICLVLANRDNGTFIREYENIMRSTAGNILERLTSS